MTTAHIGKIGKEDVKCWDGKTRTFTRRAPTGGFMNLHVFDWPGIDVLQVYGGGTDASAKTINAALTAVGTNPCTFWLAPVDWTIDATVTVPTTVSLACPQGIDLQVASGITLTINGAILAGAYQIWTATGTVTLANNALDLVFDRWDGSGSGINAYRYETIWKPAEEMVSPVSNGATYFVEDTTTNHITRGYWAFDNNTEQYVNFSVIMPERWDRGTFKAKFYWNTGTGGSAGEKVEWSIKGKALGDGQAVDTAWGTAQVITDTVISGATYMHITSATPAITVTNPDSTAPDLGDLVVLQVARNVSSANDDMNNDAGLIGVLLQVTLSEGVAAW